MPSESRIFSENWIIEWSYAAFSLLFNVYIRSMHVKLLQTTFSDSHRPRCLPRSRCIDSFRSFSEFPNLSLFIIRTLLLSSPSLSRKQRLVRSGCGLCNRAFYVDRLRACAVPNQSLVRKREIGFESLLLFSMHRESIRITCAGIKSFSFKLHDAPGILQSVVIIKIVWRFGNVGLNWDLF